MRIVWLTVVAVIAAGVTACAPAAGGESPHPAAIHASTASTRPSHAGPPAASAHPSPSASPVIQVTGAPGGVKAKGAVLADAATGQVLWGRDLGTERPMASVTKVMTALLVLESGNLGQQIRVPKAAFNYAWKYGGETAALHPGDTLTAQQLLAALLLPSGADAAYTLANAYGPGLDAFVARMNATAVRMGMTAHPFHLAGRAALSHRDRDLLHAVRPAHARPRGDAVPGLPVDRGPAVLPPAEGARAPPVLVGQHRRADRLLSGCHGDQDRLHRRGPALPAVRGGQERPDADRGRPGQPGYRRERPACRTPRRC